MSSKRKFITNVKRPKICLWSKTNGLTNWERLPLPGFHSGPTARACGRCCLLLYGLLNGAGRFSFQIAAARGADSAGQPEGCVEAGGGLGAAWLDQVPAHADAGALYVGGRGSAFLNQVQYFKIFSSAADPKWFDAERIRITLLLLMRSSPNFT